MLAPSLLHSRRLRLPVLSLVAAVVLAPGEDASEDDLRAFVRERLRGSKTPDSITFRESLPHTPTGKMLRRVVQEELSTTLTTDRR